MIPTALLLGDSQTQLGWGEAGWVTLVAEKFVRRLDLVNRGLSGYNTRMLLAVLPDILAAEPLARVTAVTLMMGSNDASFPDTNPEQAVPLEEFGDNLLKIVSLLLNHGIKKEAILLVSPPPILPDKWAQYRRSCPGPEYRNCKDNQLTAQYAEETGRVAARLGLGWLDLFSAMMKLTNLEAALGDGLHLAGEGHAVLYQLLCPELERRLGPGPGHAAPRFPEWRELGNQSGDQCAAGYTKWKLDNPGRV